MSLGASVADCVSLPTSLGGVLHTSEATKLFLEPVTDLQKALATDWFVQVLQP